jgi:lipoyl(octanoyl) transferase
VPYPEALELQRRRRDARLAGQVGDVLWLLEHDPVITVGRRPVADLQRSALSVPVVESERGGLATYHGPGQLVGYLIADIASRGGSVRGTIAAIEEGLIGWLAQRGLAASRSTGRPGVWVGGEKIAAIGMHFRRGVSMHGFALNLTVDLRGFEGFVPCGLADAGVTSVARVAGESLEPVEAWPSVGASVRAALAPRRWTRGAPAVSSAHRP